MLAESAGITAMSLFNRYCGWRRDHPMFGGVMRVWRGSVDDYLALRKSACAAEFFTRDKSLNPSVIRSSSDD
jgi:hypothetical protein